MASTVLGLFSTGKEERYQTCNMPSKQSKQPKSRKSVVVIDELPKPEVILIEAQPESQSESIRVDEVCACDVCETCVDNDVAGDAGSADLTSSGPQPSAPPPSPAEKTQAEEEAYNEFVCLVRAAKPYTWSEAFVDGLYTIGGLLLARYHFEHLIEGLLRYQ